MTWHRLDLLPIHTRRLVLRQFTIEDLEAFQAYRSDSELARYQDWDPMPDADARVFLSDQAQQVLGAADQWLQVAVTRRDTGEVIGDLGLCMADESAGVVELGFTLAPWAQHQGYATEAVAGVLDALLGQARVRAVTAVTDARNAAALALLQRLGFELEGTAAAVFRGAVCQEHRFRLHQRLGAWLIAGVVVSSMACVWAAPQSSPVATTSSGPISIDIVPVPLHPQNPSEVAIGDFLYAGGLELTSRQTDRLHGLSDLLVTATGTLTAIGDEGIFLDARLVLDEAERLVGLTDARLTLLRGEDGKPLSEHADADAEGLALLPGGDRLVSFERRNRIWLYPAAGGPPRPVPMPGVSFPPNGGMEALAADPEAGADAYVVGAEVSGDTWTCHVLSIPCLKGPTVGKPEEFGLVAINRLPGMQTVYLLRAFDAARGSRISLQIFRSTGMVARMDMAPPMTVDNFEGLASVPRPDGGVRFYLISDDNTFAGQRTLLLAFDWRPR